MPEPKKLESQSTRVLAVRLNYGDDLLLSLQRIIEEEGIRFGCLTFLGAVQRGVVAYYNQKERKYHTIVKDEPLEIASGIGNISLKDGKPFIHAHVAFADSEGKIFGGHLAEGTIVFAGEVFIQVLELPQPPTRKYDAQTGLFLW